VDAHTDVLHFVGEAGAFQRYWLQSLLSGGVGVQICPVYGEGARRSDAREPTLDQVAEFNRVVDANAGLSSTPKRVSTPTTTVCDELGVML